VAGRALAFSDPAIGRMAVEDFVPVAGDDWYERRRDDAEGRFFRAVADQGPRKGEGGSTRQGIYVFTADGQLLVYRNSQDAAVMRDVLRQGLAAWNNLPAGRRQPGAVRVGDAGETDARYTRTPPAGTLVVNFHTRILDRAGKDDFCRGTCGTVGGDHAALDHLWITAAECRALVPEKPHHGDKVPLPPAVVERILRFHLVDNTRGEPAAWHREDIRSQDLTLTVEQAGDDGVGLRLEGSALLATDADLARARRGFDVRLLGHLHYDAGKKAFDRFDVVALGEHWGDSKFTPGARPGRTPLGVAFELANGTSPADRVPPQGARDLGEYLGQDR
jgi:hypothetical protein